jgi:hypothetical protein
MWEIDNLTDSTIEEIIINMSDSSSTEWSDDEKEN